MNGISYDSHILSKSTFLRGLQCPKSLYINKYHPELRDELDPAQEEIFQRGIDIGILARELFPGGIDASPEEQGNYAEAVQHTRELISKGVPVIYEAAFQHEGVLCLVDILASDKEEWSAYEVTSSTRISDIYLIK